MRRNMFLLLTVIMLAMVFSTTALAQDRFVAHLNGIQEVPANNSTANGACSIVLNATETQITVNCTYTGLSSNPTGAHIHDNGPVGVNGPVRFSLGTITGTSGTIGPLNFAVTPAQVADMRAKRHYVNIHSSNFPGGEIRGQVKPTETVMDQDGDGRTDLTVFRQSTNSFYTLFSTNRSLFINQFTTENFYTHLNHTADFDGDGRADPLLLERGAGNVVTWSILQTGTNTVRRVQWGNQTSTNRERFALADYDGDGKMDIAVYRQSQATWYILESSTGNGRFERFGAITDNPAVGDYDKDGKADLTVTRVENGQHAWYTRLSSTGQDIRVLWGNSQTDTTNFFTPVDFDGDGAQDRMVTRPVDGQIQFNILLSSNGSQLYLTFGLTEDVRLFGDYDGDGKTDIVARRVINGQMTWFILLSSSGYNVTQHRTEPWGITDDQLVEEPEMLLDRFEPKTD